MYCVTFELEVIIMSFFAIVILRSNFSSMTRKKIKASKEIINWENCDWGTKQIGRKGGKRPWQSETDRYVVHRKRRITRKMERRRLEAAVKLYWVNILTFISCSSQKKNPSDLKETIIKKCPCLNLHRGSAGTDFRETLLRKRFCGTAL